AAPCLERRSGELLERAVQSLPVSDDVVTDIILLCLETANVLWRAVCVMWRPQLCGVWESGERG
ncbi:MAG: hypothetical protein L0312_04065, partial [Acidobacteria bacterium]|nr:hypothetical protein [Acidobacteriota bacterium]